MSSNYYNCVVCSKTYKGFNVYKKHIASAHNNDNDTETQQGNQEAQNNTKVKTTKTKPRKPKLGRPRKVHQLPCSKCNKMFHSKYTLVRHIKEVCDPTGYSLANRIGKELPPETIVALTSYVQGTMGGNTGKRGRPKTNPGLQQNGDCNILQLLTNSNNQLTQNNLQMIQNNNINNNENNIRIEQPVKLNPFGQETLDHITKEDKLRILNQGLGAVPALVKEMLKEPSNRNLAITDKRNKKVTFVNDDGELEIAPLENIIQRYTTDNIDRIDVYIDECAGEISDKNKTIQRLIAIQSFSEADIENDTKKFEDYHDKCGTLLIDVLNVNKTPNLEQIKKYSASLRLKSSNPNNTNNTNTKKKLITN